MNRELKFRVKFYSTGEIRCLDIQDFDNMDMSELEILGQYTGLKDKNGVEIYENDIVDIVWANCFASIGGMVSREIIVWDKAWFGHKSIYKTPDSKIHPLFELVPKPCYVHGESEMLDHHYEVIGNIYENPELLNND